MNKLNIIVLFLLLFLLIPVIAEDDLGTFKSGSDINLIQLCGTCTENNITSVYSPSSIELVHGINMTKNGTQYTYLLDGNYTSEFGEYVVNGVGDVYGIPTVWVYTFNVTPSGTDLSLVQGIIYCVILIILIVMFLLSVIGAVRINGSNEYDIGGNFMSVNFNKYFKMGLFFLSYLLLIFIVFISYTISSSFMFLTFTAEILGLIHTILWILLLPIFIAFVVVALIKFTLDMRLDKLAERHLKPREGGKRKW